MRSRVIRSVMLFRISEAKQMNDASLQFNIGSVGSRYGQLKFSFVVSNDGNAYLQIYASDPSDLRISGVLLMLDEHGYGNLKQLIAKTDQSIERLRSSGQLLKMLVSYSRDASIQLNLGSVGSSFGQLTFSFIVQNDGSGHLSIYASDPTNLRKSGVLVSCDGHSFESLQQLIGSTDELIAKLQASNQMRRMLISYS
jgi:hypothetical protein